MFVFAEQISLHSTQTASKVRHLWTLYSVRTCVCFHALYAMLLFLQSIAVYHSQTLFFLRFMIRNMHLESVCNVFSFCPSVEPLLWETGNGKREWSTDRYKEAVMLKVEDLSQNTRYIWDRLMIRQWLTADISLILWKWCNSSLCVLLNRSDTVIFWFPPPAMTRPLF